MRFVLVSLAVLLVSPAVRAVCGDGVLDGADTCDDGNTIAGDGCSPTCAIEAGFSCDTLTPVALGNGGFEGGAPTSGAWEVATGNVDWVDGTSFGGCMPAGEGTYSIDLNGDRQGAIAQSFATTAGSKYAVSFLGSANCVSYSGQSCSTTCERTLTVGIAEDTAEDAFTDCLAATKKIVYRVQGSPLAKGWQRLRLEFTASATKTLVCFEGSDTALAGPMIDDVTIAASNCRKATCGNGTVEAGEACDDGNTTSGDGCQSDCSIIEAGWDCATAGHACAPVCGDAIVIGNEECDDGGIPTAGCTNCRLDSGFTCDGTLTSTGCIPSCGAGYVMSSDFLSCMDYCQVPGTCGANETCGHDPVTNEATCTCQDGYTKDDNGACVGGTLAVSPEAVTLAPLQQQLFVGSGTVPPYTFSLLATSGSGGSVDASTGLYTAGKKGSTTDTVQVKDANGKTANATITITAALSLTPAKATVPPRGSLQLTAAGGLPPYTWKFVRESEAAVSATGLYTACARGGYCLVHPPMDGLDGEYDDVVEVTDAAGVTADAQITVGPPIQIDQAKYHLYPFAGWADDFTASGGDGKYTWSLSKNGSGGTIDQQGHYKAGPKGQTLDVITVTDSLGNSASLELAINNAPTSSGGCTSSGPMSTPFAGLLALVSLAAIAWLRRRPAA